MKITFAIAAGLAALSISITGCATSAPSIPDAKRASWIDGACSAETPGVTLAVDFRGDVSTHCAISFQGNSWDLFGAAGFEVRGTDKYPTAFACQINQQPADAACDDSASSAYWGYYIPTDGTWGYATTGASDHQTVCGTWEGWVYMDSEKTVSKLPAPTEFDCN